MARARARENTAAPQPYHSRFSHLAAPIIARARLAAHQVNELFGGAMSAQTFNQATRWINTKEEHCKKIITCARAREPARLPPRAAF